VAQKIQTIFVEDIDGGEAEGTVRFGLDGADYEIDLSVAHSEELHKAFAPYIAHARKVGGIRRAVRGRRGGSAIDTREARVAARLRAIERAYRTAIEHDAAVNPEPATIIRPADHVADHEMELE
jgi:Lsr2